MKVAAILAVVLALILVGPRAVADQKDPRLNDLFSMLKQVPNQQQGQLVADVIWEIWFEAPTTGTDILLKQGQKSMKAGNFDDALATFDALVELEPSFAEAWNRRATLHFLMGNYNASIADVERTLSLEPRHFGAISGLGHIYEAIGEDEAALIAYRKALEINPHMPAIRALAGKIEATLQAREI